MPIFSKLLHPAIKQQDRDKRIKKSYLPEDVHMVDLP